MTDDVFHPDDFQDFHSGFVALIGEPNIGKSTLLNALLDFKLAIVSPKPQTTRDRILGIYTDDSCQIAFVDTPGVMEPRDRFNEYLRDNALEALDNADAAYHLVDALQPKPLPPAAAEALTALRGPAFLVVNKCDRLEGFEEAIEDPAETQGRLGELVRIPFSPQRYAGVVYISALRRIGLDALREKTQQALPEGPPLYDPDQLTDRDMRFLAAEIVREKVLEHTRQEVPYAVATRTEEFLERERAKHRVRVVVYVEHESQKSILIGRGGEMLRRIGSEARPGIEEMCDHPIYLELWVKVRKNWRKRETSLREFGYNVPSRKKKKKR